MMRRRVDWKFVALIAALAVLAAARFVYLNADSPESPFWMYDEGHWLHNARNQILFHRWIVDDFNQGLVTPVFTALESAAFRLLGVGLLQARLATAVVALVTQFVLYRWIRTAGGRHEAAFGTLLFSASSTVFDYNRLALPETTLLLFLILAGWMWSRALQRSVYGLASGLAFMIACLTKPTAVFFFPIPFLVLLLESDETGPLSLTDRIRRLFRAPQRTQLALFLLGCTVVVTAGLIVALVLGLLRSSVGMEALLAWGKAPESFSRVFVRLLALPIRHFFRTVSMMMLLSSLYIMQRCAGARRGASTFVRFSPLELIALIWLVLGFFFCASVTYYADRYLMVLVPAMCILGARAISDAAKVDDEYASASSDTVPTVLLLVALIAPLITVLTPATTPLFGSTEFNAVPSDFAPMLIRIATKIAVAAGVLGAFLAIGYRSIRRRAPVAPFVVSAYPVFLFTWALLSGLIFVLGRNLRAGLSSGLSMEASSALALLGALSVAVLVVRTPLVARLPRTVQYAPALLVAAVLIINGLEIGAFFVDRTYTEHATALELRQYLSRGSVILGDVADSLALSTEAGSIRTYLGMNQGASQRFHPDYILNAQVNARRDIPPKLSAQYAEYSNLRLVRRFWLLPLDRDQTVYNFVLDLYAVPKEPGAN